MRSWSNVAKEKGIRYFLIAFVDLFGTMRAKIVPVSAMDGVCEIRGGFCRLRDLFQHDAGRQRYVRRARIPESLIDQPWEAGWWSGRRSGLDGKPVAGPRRAPSKRLIAAAAEAGLRLKTGVECEYFLISPDGAAISDDADTPDQALL